jgi:hypothetical protein
LIELLPSAKGAGQSNDLPKIMHQDGWTIHASISHHTAIAQKGENDCNVAE